MAIDFSAAVSAAQTIRQFPGQINVAASTVANVPLGPWYIGTSCHYGPCNRASTSYGATIDYNQSRAIILADLQNISSITQNFIAQLQSEIKSLNNAALTIMGALQQVLGQYQNPDFNSRSTTVYFLNTILDAINHELPVLTSDNQSIASFSKQLSDAYSQVVNAQSNLYNLNGGVNSSISQEFDGKPCGQNDAKAQLNFYEAQFNTSYATISSTIGALNQQALNTLNALSVMIGSFSVFITQWNAGLQDVVKAMDAPSYNLALQKLDVAIALDQWNALYTELSQINF